MESLETIIDNKYKKAKEVTTPRKLEADRIYTNRKIELSVASHNINGLKMNSQKIESLYEWMLDNKIDVMGLAETNISAKEGFFLVKNLVEYKGFWANASSDKKKGSGVSLLVSKQWEKHLG